MTAGISYGSPRGAGSLGDASATGRSSPRNTSENKSWTSEDIYALRTLWDEGHSTVEIGRRMGLTKNAIIGKAHRLELPARESPIIRDGRAPKDGRPAYVRPPRVTLPLLASQIAEPAVVQFALPLAMLKPVVVAPRPVRAVLAPVVALPMAKPVQAPKPFARTTECLWPIGDVGTREFHFCDAPHRNRTYCDDHEKIAYLRARRSDLYAAD